MKDAVASLKSKAYGGVFRSFVNHLARDALKKALL